MKIAFYFFLSRWKGSERSGGNLRWFPLDPLSTFDGDAVPLDSPCSRGGGGRFSSSRSGNGTARATFHRRATGVEKVLGKASVSRRSFGDGRGGRRCGEKVEFSNAARAKSERRRKAKVTTRGRAWPDTEILAGIGSGHSPPTAALEDKQAAANAAPDGGKTGRRARRHACRKI